MKNRTTIATDVRGHVAELYRRAFEDVMVRRDGKHPARAHAIAWAGIEESDDASGLVVIVFEGGLPGGAHDPEGNEVCERVEELVNDRLAVRGFSFRTHVEHDTGETAYVVLADGSEVTA